MTAYAYRDSLGLLSTHSDIRRRTAGAIADDWRGNMSRTDGVQIADFGAGDGDLLAKILAAADAPRWARIHLIERDRKLASIARRRLAAMGYDATSATDDQMSHDGSIQHLPRGSVTHFLAANVVHYLPDRLTWVASVLPLLAPDGVMTIVMRSAGCETRRLADIVRKAAGTPRPPSDGPIAEVVEARGFGVSRRAVSGRFAMPVAPGWVFNAAATGTTGDADHFVSWMLSIPPGSTVPTECVGEIRDFLSMRVTGGRLVLRMESIVLAAHVRP